MDHRLAGVLLLDADPALLRPLADWLARGVREVTGEPTRLVTLGSHTGDDDLWVQARFRTDDRGLGVEMRAGRLVESADTDTLIVVVPDLFRAGLAVHRAVVSALGAEVAVVERYGRHGIWAPRARWLVACRRSEAMQLSAHLLDRFAVRLDARGWDPDAGWPSPSLSPPVAPARPGPRTAERIAATTVPSDGLRRDLAVGRVARALATIRGAAEIADNDVYRSASLLALDFASLLVDDGGVAGDSGDDGTVGPRRLGRELTGGAPPSDIAQPGSAAGGSVALPAHTRLFPEDDPDALAAPSALRVPWPERVLRGRARGPVIGAERTRDLRDFAVVHTLFEALRFQTVRRPDGGRLDIRESDLRRFRRRPLPGTALVLVLDHTSVSGWDSAAAMAPYLRWAYGAGALVTVIEFGHRGGAHELRAERFRADSVLHPRVALALNRRAGRASPLAYALDLAVDELRFLLRRRQPPAEDVLLLVVTDGRGNVPLEASVRGAVDGPVGRRGVDDAVAVAGAVATLRRVRTVVLAPDLAQYPQLPFDLADAMNGMVMTSYAYRPASLGQEG